MANICDTQYKVTGSRKAVADLGTHSKSWR